MFAGDVLTLVSAAVGAFGAQALSVFVITPIRDRQRMEMVADRAAAKAIAAHEDSCRARTFVGPVADSES